ncbi:hypothetical protein [Ferruginibacter sp. SUN106]|uniref:hypothetical protein n=1 Tax=Ferruginibacter sp. SUN106 TaxID=2978348 RepID=UPI003D35EC21
MDDKANKIRQISLDENPVSKLVDLVYLLSAQGMTRQNIYDLYLKYLVDHQDSDEWITVQNKFNGDHPVEIILDCLSGWCRPESILLPNEPFQKS